MSEFQNEQPTGEERPLVTLALFAYNQEKYIQDAVEGAFSQIYSPLEIILTDDCSTDRTFEIMEEMASNYKGAHKLYLNRNEVNLGVSSHVNKVIALANGSLIVAAAGDDISFSNRVSELTNFWAKHGKPSGIIYSKYQPIDSEGSSMDINCICEDTSSLSIQDFIHRFNPGIVGGTQAWTKDFIMKFDLLPKGLFCEDAIFAFRAKLYGQVLFLDQVLLKYRIHSSSLSTDELTFTEQLKKDKQHIDIYNIFISDIMNSMFGNPNSDLMRENLICIIQEKIKQMKLDITLIEGDMIERIASAFQLSKDRGFKRLIRNVIIALLPTLFCAYKDKKHKSSTIST